MKKYNEIEKLKYNEKEFNEKKEEVLNLIIKYGDGFYDTESSGGTKWQWNKKESTIFITNTSTQKKVLSLKAKIYSGYEESSKLYIEVNGDKYIYDINNKGIDINIDIKTNSEKMNVIKLYTDAKKIIASNDSRDMYFRLENLTIEYKK